MTKGYAVKNRSGQILINTVSITEKGAIMNWLVTEAKVMVYNSATDEQINSAFNKLSHELFAHLVRVEIKEI